MTELFGLSPTLQGLVTLGLSLLYIFEFECAVKGGQMTENWVDKPEDRDSVSHNSFACPQHDRERGGEESVIIPFVYDLEVGTSLPQSSAATHTRL